MANETLNIQNGVSPITIDTEVTEGSMRPVTSDGIYKAIQAGGGGGLPTPDSEGSILKTARLGEESLIEWRECPLHDFSDFFTVELEFDGETWTHPEYQFSSLTSKYETHSVLYARINGITVFLHPTSVNGFNAHFATEILPLDKIGLTDMVGFLNLFYDEDEPGGWGISLNYWAASTM